MTRTLNLEAREKILDAALELIHERGYRDVSMDEVAAAAGLKKANLFHYYRTKENLGLAALDLAVRRQRDQVAERFSRAPGDPIQTIAAMFSETAEGMRRAGCHRGCLIGNLAQELSDYNEKFRGRLQEYLEYWAGELADMLERARRGGYFRRGFRPREAATALISLYEGATTVTKTRREPAALEAAGRMAVDYLKSWRA